MLSMMLVTICFSFLMLVTIILSFLSFNVPVRFGTSEPILLGPYKH